jgi:hypothetical protein
MPPTVRARPPHHKSISATSADTPATSDIDVPPSPHKLANLELTHSPKTILCIPCRPRVHQHPRSTTGIRCWITITAIAANPTQDPPSNGGRTRSTQQRRPHKIHPWRRTAQGLPKRQQPPHLAHPLHAPAHPVHATPASRTPCTPRAPRARHARLAHPIHATGASRTSTSRTRGSWALVFARAILCIPYCPGLHQHPRSTTGSGCWITITAMAANPAQGPPGNDDHTRSAQRGRPPKVQPAATTALGPPGDEELLSVRRRLSMGAGGGRRGLPEPPSRAVGGRPSRGAGGRPSRGAGGGRR